MPLDDYALLAALEETQPPKEHPDFQKALERLAQYFRVSPRDIEAHIRTRGVARQAQALATQKNMEGMPATAQTVGSFIPPPMPPGPSNAPPLNPRPLSPSPDPVKFNYGFLPW